MATLELKELYNRVYDGKQCNEFFYKLRSEESGEELAEAHFKRSQENPTYWDMDIMFRSQGVVSVMQLYAVTYSMPKADVPLTWVCATGMRYFQLKIKEEVQEKSLIDFQIGSVISSILSEAIV